MVGRAESPQWVLFCTISNTGHPFVIGVAENEIEAVRHFSDHVEKHGERHRKYIHMELLREEWGEVRQFDVLWNTELDPDNNLFRVPMAR